MTSSGIADRDVWIRAPAKLNLFLEVRGKRGDGYHELETVMVGVSLYDSLRFRAEPGNRLDVRGSTSRRIADSLQRIPFGPENLAWRALDFLRREVGLSDRLGGTLDLFKVIPDQAGLGGGSSDAAAALLAARAGWRLNLDDRRLALIGAQIGSDVPYFLTGGAAICRGRGEQVAPIRVSRPLWFVIAKPPRGLRTAHVYAALNAPRECEASDGMERALALGRVAEIGRRLHNRLQPPAEELVPEIRHAARAFAALDCYGHQMTGSGSAYFGLFGARAPALRAAARLRGRLPDWFITSCRSLALRSAPAWMSPLRVAS